VRAGLAVTAVHPSWVIAFVDLAPGDDASAPFWAAVTGYDDAEVRAGAAEFPPLRPPSGDPYLYVQRLGTGEGRIHLDLFVSDLAAGAAAATGLGATEHARTHDFVGLTSPAGIPFCVVTDEASAVPPPAPWPGGRSQVDQVCVDVAPSAFDAELAFWEALTGWSRTATDSPEFERLDDDAMPLRMLFQRLDDEEPARFHLDISSDDRAAESARHVALGATLENPSDRGFTVLVDPGGRRYCVTDRTPRG
jgi:hypothetical protein